VGKDTVERLLCSVHGWTERPYLITYRRGKPGEGRRYVCRLCDKEYRAKHAASGKRTETARKWEAANREKRRAQHRAYYYRNQEERIAAWHRAEERRQVADPTRKARMLQKVIDYSARLRMTTPVDDVATI
jgi:hypothetical protein